MHLFLSAGEPSGDLHGANLIRALRTQGTEHIITGFGGPRMEAAGTRLLYPLTNLAVMGLRRVLANLPTFFRLGRQAEDYFRHQRPDAVVLIDYPGFHFPIAKRAHSAGIPVYYFVPPQIWAWRTGRVQKVRRWFDTVLTALPFEDEWYREQGVSTHYVGHPYFDELASQQLDPAFLAQQRRLPERIVALLPGSRNQEVAANSRLMLNAARKIHASRPDVRFLVAAFNEPQAHAVRTQLAGSDLPVQVHVGRTPEIIELATACIAVSGSVSLELMYRLKPTVVVYRMGAIALKIVRKLVHCRYMSLVNLLAESEIYPEFATSGDDSWLIAGRVIEWLDDPVALHLVTRQLTDLKARVAQPGACERAARFLVERAEARHTQTPPPATAITP